ncbi:hypothetical protein GBAR_LOCUS17938 [Geodia barretti]|uniref:MYM-type domain-containing protein n=1 Tax=Geodia barretti TaxID=519541 RepID=A0AA35SKK5_GEOBA|nr:hypothetical protein GBAR_LOCUS17938 [Geodia barretti]
MDRLKVVFFSSLQRSTYPDVCVQCHSRTTGGYTATTNEGYQLRFCSPQCSHAYWDEYAKFSQSPSTLYNTQQGVPSASNELLQYE